MTATVADLVRAVLAGDMLTAKAWVMDAARAHVRWAEVPRPVGLDAKELAVAAALVELLAARDGAEAPSWSAPVGPASDEDVYLVDPPGPRARARFAQETPEPLRRRRLVAPAAFLTHV